VGGFPLWGAVVLLLTVVSQVIAVLAVSSWGPEKGLLDIVNPYVTGVKSEDDGLEDDENDTESDSTE